MFQTHPILAVRGDREEAKDDAVAVESPLEIRLEYPDDTGNPVVRPLSITMRTPGEDADLALGYLWTEGVLRGRDDVRREATSDGSGVRVDESASIATVALRSAPTVAWAKLERSTVTTGACGMCGKTSLDAVRTGPYAVIPRDTPRVPRKVIAELPDVVRAQQNSFAMSGGEHASALCTARGEVVCVREDVGRHNALDKLIGDAFRRGTLPLHDLVLVLSGRASFELIQKSAMAGISFIIAVGAPSSAAIELATELEMTLVGFARGANFNIYCGGHRVVRAGP